MQWPLAENNPHRPKKIFAMRVCRLDKHCRNSKEKFDSVLKVLTANLSRIFGQNSFFENVGHPLSL